ncbi:MAG: aspartate--tRNA ligase [archaeon]
MLRTHHCNELRNKDLKKNVVLCGWVQTRRDHGGVIFIDLRDRYGLTQVVFDPSHNKKIHAMAEKIRREFVLMAKGKVRARGKDLVNKKLDTGEIEVFCDDLEILNMADVPPLEIDDRKIASDDTRLKYRYLDLRRPEMQRNFLLRHKAAQATRKFLDKQGFLEIETPMLLKSTPEGARDYIVPSRVNPGTVYSLPQSPQLYKQILMISGFDRYFQIAKCLRDEDLRIDRQPEFTQIDFEMSFVSEEDIFNITEGIVSEILTSTVKKKIKTPFKILTYKESIERFGTDKPDLRFGLELIDVTDIVKHSDFSVFKTVADKKGKVKCIKVKADLSRNKLDELIEFVKVYKAKGMAWMKYTDKLESSIVKYFNNKVQNELVKKTKIKNGEYLLFIADKENIVHTALANLRNKLGQELKLFDPTELNFVWIKDFPLFDWDDEIEEYTPAHHMFTMPTKETIQYIEKNPEKVISYCFDLVLNGVELGSGSIRVHKPDIQEKIMKTINISDKEAKQKFGFLLEAMKYGAPPHGGFAIGFDRLLAVLLSNDDIREVIAFPKNKNAQCPMDDCPSTISDKELKEVHLKWNIIKKK